MKKAIIVILVGLFCGGTSFSREKAPNKIAPSSHLTKLNLSFSSKISYNEALNRFNWAKPDGWAIAGMRYFRRGAEYVLAVELIKVR